MEFLGIKWVGINPRSGQKPLLSVAFIVIVLLLGAAARWISRFIIGHGTRAGIQGRFWTRQGISLLAAVVLILGLLSIWFNDPTRLSTVFGLMTAGLAFALQQVVTAVAGYFVILRGATFTVGDRISMGGVRGDVVRLGFIQTTIMERGQPSSVQAADPVMWVKSRQFTGRIVTVGNSKIFSEPVFNYTRDFPFIWEEMTIPITYKDERRRVERILIEAARRHARDPLALAASAKADLQGHFAVEQTELEPRVFMRITDNWLELTVRFIVATHRIRLRQGCDEPLHHRRTRRRRHRHRVGHLRHRRFPADRPPARGGWRGGRLIGGGRQRGGKRRPARCRVYPCGGMACVRRGCKPGSFRAAWM